MTRESILIILGVLVIIAPFAGLPNAWLMVILPLIGAITLIIGISLRHARHQSSILAALEDTP